MSGSQTPSSAATGYRSARALRTVIALGAISLCFYASWSIYLRSESGQRFRHRQVTRSIYKHYRRALDIRSAETDPKKERGRIEIIGAFGTAMANWPFYSPKGCIPEKVAAIADRLDTTDGADLRTFEGCCELLVLCDEASWTFYDYPLIATLYELEQTGEIPKLPPLGARWKNDPRRKAWDAKFPGS